MSSRATRRTALIAGAASLLLTVRVHAEEPARLPAVSGLNGRLQAEGGIQDGDGRWGGAGSITAPLGLAFGVQADAYAVSLGDDFLGGAGAHLFWRDPAVGLAGLYGSYAYFDAGDGFDQGRVGPEAELYLDRFTLYATVGAQFGDARHDVYSIEDVAFYPSDDIRLSVGHRYSDDGHIGAAEGEIQVYSGDSLGVALFAEGRFGGDEEAAWAGLRLYFGSDKPLIRRHREDDPPLLEDDDTHSLVAGVEPPPTPSLGGGE